MKLPFVDITSRSYVLTATELRSLTPGVCVLLAGN